MSFAKCIKDIVKDDFAKIANDLQVLILASESMGEQDLYDLHYNLQSVSGTMERVETPSFRKFRDNMHKCGIDRHPFIKEQWDLLVAGIKDVRLHDAALVSWEVCGGK